MNNSVEEVLGSIINAHHIEGGDLFYIGTGIGLSAGLLCACIIARANYYKRKHAINTASNDETIIKELFAKGEIIQVI
uniref:Uncharacterized protein n=1 Tax=viral metagenome TaxID=1070528 RepID=A0A6C0D3W2_9ZZZZ